MLDKFKKGVKRLMDNVIEKVEVTKEVIKVVASNDIMIRKIGVLIVFVGLGVGGGLIAYSAIK